MRLYNEIETLAALRGAGRYTFEDNQVFGVTPSGNVWNPYINENSEMSPVGLFLFWIGLDPQELETISEKHMLLCDTYECNVCSEEGGYADTSLYSRWVQDWMRKHDVELTEEARDLLWEAETSGLALYEWLEVQHDRANV